MSSEPTYAFGPFVFDPHRRRLIRGDESQPLPERQTQILRLLVSRPGEIVTRDALLDAAWKDLAITDNTIERTISTLRRRLGPLPDGRPHIEAVPRRGYRFCADVTATQPRQADDALAALLRPYEVFLEGRAALETLEVEAVRRARAAFDEVVAGSPDYAPGHLGLANAHALLFDATRGDDRPDRGALEAAMRHAQEACRLAADSGEAWATLAFVLSRTGRPEAAAAGRRAIALEPDNWRHHLRLAYAAWGEARLRAARDAARLLPGLGLAHWLAATVHVARGAFGEAARELEADLAAQDSHEGRRFRPVGLHLLLGLVRLAEGDLATAGDELARELAAGATSHLYARQAAAHALSAEGAIKLRQGRTAEASAAFEQALDRQPGHALSLAALAAIAGQPALRARLEGRLAALEAAGALVDAAMGRAVGDVLAGRPAEAAHRLRIALDAAPSSSSAGWTIPVEPLLQVAANPAPWRDVLARVRERAA